MPKEACPLYLNLTLKALLQGHVPGSSLDIGRLLVVAIFESRGYEWRFRVEYVVHAERDRCVIEPRAPAARIVLRGGHWHHVLQLFRRRVLPAVLGVSGN